MSTQHTPGPWMVYGEQSKPSGFIGDEGVWRYEVTQQSELCRCGVRLPMAHKEGRANAMLMAAAPEMLTALRAIVECDEPHRMVAAAQAAIAEAEGTQGDREYTKAKQD